MKALILVLCLGFASLSFAEEVETDCPAMNQDREKVIRTVQTKTESSKGASAQ